MSNGITIEVFTNTGNNYPPVQIIQVDENEQPIIVQTSEYYAPVQSVNGKIGFVVITKEDLGLTGLATSGDLLNYATLINLASTGSTLSANLASTGSTLSANIHNLSGVVVLKYGDQTITGIKTFISRPFVNGTGILLSGEIPTLPTTLVYTSGDQFINGQKTFLIQPGKHFWVDSENLDSAHGWLYINQIDASLGYSSNSLNIDSDGLEILGQTNFDIVPTVNNIKVVLSGEAATPANLTTTGYTLQNNINSLSGMSVLTFGNQNIFGTKYFNNSVYIHDLYVTGTEFIANVENNYIESSYILLNLTGGAVDGGIFFVTGLSSGTSGTPLTGINDYGPIIGFDHSNKFKFGIARRSDDLSILNDIASVQDITNYSGFADNKYYSKNNPSGFITGLDTSNFYTKDNPSGFIGNYNYKVGRISANRYLSQEITLNSQELNSPVNGIKNGDIVNLYFSGPVVDNGVKTTYSKTLKVNPGVLVDHNGAASSRNLIKFDDTTQYSGKAIRKVRYNSTIGNGYERINLTNLSVTVNPAIIRPLTRRLETFYDISVPSGGGVRALYFNRPTSPHFVQGLCMNLRFSFEADSSPCVISGYSAHGLIFLLTGANYNFIQKERVILINKGTAPHYEFIHW